MKTNLEIHVLNEEAKGNSAKVGEVQELATARGQYV